MSEVGARHLDKRRVRQAFDRAAHRYDEVAYLQREVSERLLERLDLIRLNPRRVLDLGAGTGGGSRALVRRYRGARVIGLDVSHAMARRARRQAPGLFPRQRFICGDAEQIPLHRACADLVFSSLALQWCPAPGLAFREVRRVLSPGGLLLFSTLGPETLHELRESWASVDSQVHVNHFIDMHDLGDLLVAEGYRDVVMDAERLTVNYGQVIDLMRELKALGAHNASAGRPRALTGRARLQRLIAAYEAFRRDGRFPATYEVVYGHAWAPEVPGHTVPRVAFSRTGSQ